MSMNFYVSQVNAGFQLLSIAIERTYLTGVLHDDNGKKLADVQFNWNGNFDHPRVIFTQWAKDCGWTKLYNKDWFIHDKVLEGLIEEGIVPGVKAAAPKQQTKQEKSQQTQAPKPQQAVSEIVRQKVKVSQAPKPQAKKETQQEEIVIPKPQKAEGIKMMSDEELAKEIHKISDFEDDFVDPDLL